MRHVPKVGFRCFYEFCTLLFVSVILIFWCIGVHDGGGAGGDLRQLA
jgi:hypothetical protein